MVQNILIYCGPDGAAEFAGKLSRSSGDDLGLVNTCLDPSEVKTSGCRIEDERTYGGVEMSAFDEPIAVGSAVAQLAGHADAVVIERLDDWVDRLAGHHGSDKSSITAEITSMCSVMKAGLLDMLIVTRKQDEGSNPNAALLAEVLAQVEPLCSVVADLSTGEPQVLRGELPA